MQAIEEERKKQEIEVKQENAIPVEDLETFYRVLSKLIKNNIK